MNSETLNEELVHLEKRIHDLADWCSSLQVENKSLRNQQTGLVEERARLIEKNELARTKVEQMIQRLKSLEASQ